MSDSTDKHQVAIVGCGIIGRTHADTIAARPDATVTALVDGDAAAREALAARLKEAGQPEPQVYDDLAAALSGSDISLVAICTPSGTHAALAEQALNEKKHVVIEKPLDVDLIRARRLGAAATRAASHGVVSSVISQHRFDPGSALVAQAIRRRPLRPTHLRRRDGRLVAQRRVLRVRRLAWHLGAGRRWRADEPGRAHRRPAAVVHGPPGEHPGAGARARRTTRSRSRTPWSPP